MANVLYVSVVGSLMSAMMCTQPDICFMVGMVSRYQSYPRDAHWYIVKRIFRYLRGTVNFTLWFLGGAFRLVGFSDADGSADRDEGKSVTSYAFVLRE